VENNMPCRKKTYTKVMNNVRRQYPKYGLKRRKKIVGAILYRRRKK